MSRRTQQPQPQPARTIAAAPPSAITTAQPLAARRGAAAGASAASARASPVRDRVRPNIAGASSAAAAAANGAAARPVAAAAAAAQHPPPPSRSRSSSLSSQLDLPSSLQEHDLHFPPSRVMSPDRRGGAGGGGGAGAGAGGPGGAVNSSLHNSRRSSLNASAVGQQPLLQPWQQAQQQAQGQAGANKNMSFLSMSQLDSMVTSPPRPLRYGGVAGGQQQQPPQQPQPQWLQPPQQTQVHIHQYVSPPHGPGYSHLLSPGLLPPPQQMDSSPSPSPQPYASQMYGAGGGGNASGMLGASQYQHLMVPTHLQSSVAPTQQFGPTATASHSYAPTNLQQSSPFVSYGSGSASNSAFPAATTAASTVSRYGSALNLYPNLSSTQEGVVRHPAIPQSMLSPRSRPAPYREPSPGAPGQTTDGTNGGDNLSASYARLNTLSSSVRDLKQSAQLTSYQAFQGELHKELYVLALEHWAHKEHLKVFRSWRYIVADRLHRLAHFRSHLTSKRVHGLFSEWGYRAAWKRRLRALTIVALEHWNRVHLRKSFHRLLLRVRGLHSNESSIIGSKLGRIFAEWSLASRIRENQTKRVEMVAARVKQHMSQVFLDRWKRAMFQTIVGRELFARTQRQRYAGVWATWLQCRFYNQLEARIRFGSLRSCLSAAYMDWRYAFTLRLMAAKYRLARASHQMIVKWRASSERHQRVLYLQRRAHLYQSAQVFGAWRFSQRLQRARLQAERFAVVSTQAKVLRLWARNMHEVRREALAWRMGEGFHAEHRCKAAVQAWALFSRASKRLRNQASMIAHMHRFHQMQAALVHWVQQRHENVRDRLQSLQAARQFHGWKLRSTMHAWANVVRAKYGRPLRRNLISLPAPAQPTSRAARAGQSNYAPSASAYATGSSLPPFSPGGSVRFEIASPRGASSLITGDDFYTTASASMPSRMTGHTRLMEGGVGMLGDDSARSPDGHGATQMELLATAAQVRIFVPYESQIAMAQLYKAHRAYRLILRRWSELTQSSLEIQRTLRPRAQILFVKHLLRGWGRTAKHSRSLRHAQVTTRANDRQALLASGWNSWVGSYNKQLSLNALVARWQTGTQGKLWLRWRTLLQTRRNQRLKRAWVETNVVCRIFWVEWRRKFRVHCVLQATLASLARRWQRVALQQWFQALRLEIRFRKVRRLVVLISSFRSWARRVSIKRNLTALTRSWDEQRPRKMAARVLAHWAHYYNYNLAARAQAEAYRLRHVWGCWVRRAHWQSFDNRVCASFAKRRELSLTAQAWVGWRQRQVDQRVEIATTRRAAIHLWVRNLAREDKERQMHQAWTARLQHATLLRVIHAFQRHAQRRKLVRRKTTQASTHLAQRILQPKAFAAWRRFVAAHKRDATSAQSLWASRMQRQLWARMVDKYLYRVALRASLSKVVRWAGRPLQNEAVQLWRRYAQNHRMIRTRMARFTRDFAKPVAALYRRKLLSEALYEWGVAFSIKRRTRGLQAVLAASASVQVMRRAWLDWSCWYRAGELQKRIKQRRAVVFLASRAAASSAGRKVRAKTEAKKARAVLDYWRIKTHRLLQHRALSNQFRAVRITQALLVDAYSVWRSTFLMLVGPLATMQAARHRTAMKRRIADWIDTLNARNVYRWAVQMFKQKLAALLDRELHRAREKEIKQRREAHAQRRAQAEAQGMDFDDDEAESQIALLGAPAEAEDDEELARELYAPHLLPSMLHQSAGGVSAPPAVMQALPFGLVDPTAPPEIASAPALPVESNLTVARFGGIVKRWRALDLALPFLQWRDVLRARKRKVAAYNCAASHEKIRKERKTFLAWVGWLARVRRARAACALGRQHTLEQMMRRWRQFVSQERQLTAATQRANTDLAQQAWNEWRARYLWEERLRSGDVNALHHWAHRLIVHNFRAWRANAHKFRSLQIRHKALVHSGLFALQYRAFAHWLALFSISSTRRRQMALAAAHERAHIFRRMLGAWRAYRRGFQAQQAVALAGFVRVHTALVANLWQFWRAKYLKSRATKRKLAAFLARNALRKQTGKFLAWRSWSQRARSDRRAVVGFIRRRLHKAFWARWIEAQRDLRRDNALQLRARQHQSEVVLPNRARSAIADWLWATRRNLHLRDSLRLVLHHRTTPKMFKAWATYVWRKRQSFRLFRARCLKRTLHLWFHRYTESKFLRSAEERVVERWEVFSLGAMLRAWKAYARKQAQLRDCARMLVTIKGGAPLYSSCASLAAVPAPGLLARSPSFVLAVRDDERQRWINQGPKAFFAPGAARREVRATGEGKNAAKHNVQQLLRLRAPSRRESVSAHASQQAEDVANLIAPFSDSVLFDPSVDPSLRREPKGASSAPGADGASSSSAQPSTTIRSLTSPDPRSLALYHQMCVGLLPFGSLTRELAGISLQAPAAKLPDAKTMATRAVDDEDGEAVIVYRSPILQLKALFTFWFTSAQLLDRARAFRTMLRRRLVLRRFQLNAEQRKLQRDKQAASADLRKRQMERHAFRLWIAGAQVQKQVDATARDLFWGSGHRISVRHGASMIRFWAAYAQKQRVLRERRREWDDNSRVYALSVWHWRAHRGRRLRQHYESLWVAHHRGVLLDRFREWRIKAVQNFHFKRMCLVLHRLHGHDVLQHWYSASLTANVADFTRKRVQLLQSQTVERFRAVIARRKKQSHVESTIIARVHARLVRSLYAQWVSTRAKVVRYNRISLRHSRNVQQDYLTAWSECVFLALNLRQRDSDFQRILALRKTQRLWGDWKKRFRFQRLERRVMERQAKAHLVEWINLMHLRVSYERKWLAKICAAWVQQVMLKRYALQRARRFHELYRSRAMLRAWRRVLLTPAQKSAMSQVALHLWRATKRRQAGVMFGHWRAIARARKPIDLHVQVIAKSRLSSMRELSHLVSSSSVSRAHLHGSRSRSPSPAASGRGAAAAPPPRSILTSTANAGTFINSPPRARRSPQPLHVSIADKPLDDGEGESKQAYYAPRASSSRSPGRSRRAAGASTVAASASFIPAAAPAPRVLHLPTASRATLASLKTFLHSPPRVGLRVRREPADVHANPRSSGAHAHTHSPSVSSDDDSDGVDASMWAHPGDRAHRRGESIESVSSTGSSVLDSPTGRHSLSMHIPAAAVRAASAHSPPHKEEEHRRSLHASQLLH